MGPSLRFTLVRSENLRDVVEFVELISAWNRCQALQSAKIMADKKNGGQATPEAGKPTFLTTLDGQARHSAMKTADKKDGGQARHKSGGQATPEAGELS
jgi:hypothetical protein